MPLKKCTNKGTSGWQWGNSGKCYTGKDAKKQAIRQGLAVEGPKKFKEEVSKAYLVDDEVAEAYAEYVADLPAEQRVMLRFQDAIDAEQAIAYIAKKERDALSSSDFGDPKNRKFPIRNQKDLDSAAHLVGRADNPEAVKKRIIAIAKRKGLTLPSAWTEDKSS